MLKKAIVPMMLLASMSHATETAHIYNWSDYVAPDTLKNFQTATGVHTTYDIYDSNETLDSKLVAGHSGYDVVFPSNHFMARQIQAGALKVLDRTQLPNWENLNPVLLKALESSDPGNLHGFPYLWGSTGIGYNLARVKAVLGSDVALNSWDLVFKPESMKKLSQCGVTFLDSAPEMMTITLNYLGLPPHSQNPADYDKAQAVLNAVKPYVASFNSSSYVDDLASGKICMAIGFSGDILQANMQAQAAKRGIDIHYVVPREGAPLWFDMVAMPSDAPDEKAGYAFMNYLMDPAAIAHITNYVHYANGNDKADSLVDAKLMTDTRVYPGADTMARLFTLEAVPSSIDVIRTRIWNEIKTAN